MVALSGFYLYTRPFDMVALLIPYSYIQDHFSSLYTRPFDWERLGTLSCQSNDVIFHSQGLKKVY